MFFGKEIFRLATSVLTEFSVSGGDGIVGSLVKQVQEYFRSTDSLKKYYDLSVDRSILSLEIALKGPKAYYPTREKEFYQKHFSYFEQKVFSPFSQEIVRKGMIQSEEELRAQCIEECEKIKQKAPGMLKIPSLSKEDIQRMVQDIEEISSCFSQDMLQEMKNSIKCRFMIPLLEKENILLTGIVFHFHNFIQADPNFSNYLNYMELSEIKKNLQNLRQNSKNFPKDKKIQSRIKRLESFVSSFSSYEEKMGAIGKKLDDIYEKTIQTYEILERLESQMKNSFSMMDERLKTIYDLILTGKKQDSVSSLPKPEIRELPKPEIREYSLEKPLEKNSPAPEILPEKEDMALPHKHKFHVVPNASLFGNIELPVQEAPCASKAIDDSLQLYSLFLQESEKESTQIPYQEEFRKNSSYTQQKITTFPWLNPEKHISREEKPEAPLPNKTRRTKADKIPSIFGSSS